MPLAHHIRFPFRSGDDRERAQGRRRLDQHRYCRFAVCSVEIASCARALWRASATRSAACVCAMLVGVPRSRSACMLPAGSAHPQAQLWVASDRALILSVLSSSCRPAAVPLRGHGARDVDRAGLRRAQGHLPALRPQAGQGAVRCASGCLRRCLALAHCCVALRVVARSWLRPLSCLLMCPAAVPLRAWTFSIRVLAWSIPVLIGLWCPFPVHRPACDVHGGSRLDADDAVRVRVLRVRQGAQRRRCRRDQGATGLLSFPSLARGLLVWSAGSDGGLRC